MPRSRRASAPSAALSAPAGQLRARLVSAAEDAELREILERYENLMGEWERLARRATVLLARRAGG